MARDVLTLQGFPDLVWEGHAIGAWKALGASRGVVPVAPLAGRPGRPLVRLGRQQPSSAGAVLVTADAIHCQDETAGTGLEQGGDYLLALKDNRPALHSGLSLFPTSLKRKRVGWSNQIAYDILGQMR